MASKNIEKEVKEAFKLFDKNGDGSISVKELKEAINSIGLDLPEKEIKEKLKEWDKDSNGSLNEEEFTALLKAAQEAEQKKAFDGFDKDGSGYITNAELKEVMKACGVKLSDKEVKEMIAAADTDKDGQVSFEEFKKMVGGCCQ